MNCPIIEQMADGYMCGLCWLRLSDGVTCPRHGNVAEELVRWKQERRGTLENVMRKRKGLLLFGKGDDS